MDHVEGHTHNMVVGPIIEKYVYGNQKAALKTQFGETGEFEIQKGVRHYCLLSPLLFNTSTQRK